MPSINWLLDKCGTYVYTNNCRYIIFMTTTKLTKETRFYYLDYLQKKLNQVVRGQELSLAALDNMLFMIMELKNEAQDGQPKWPLFQFLI